MRALRPVSSKSRARYPHLRLLEFARVGVTVVLLIGGATGCPDDPAPESADAPEVELSDTGDTGTVIDQDGVHHLRFPTAGDFGGPPPTGGDPNWGVTYYYVVMHVSETLAAQIEAERELVEEAASRLIGVSSYCSPPPDGPRYSDAMSERLINQLPEAWGLEAADVDVLHSSCMNQAGGITDNDWPDTGPDVALPDRDTETDADVDTDVEDPDAEELDAIDVEDDGVAPETTLSPLPDACEETVGEPTAELEQLWRGGDTVPSQVHVWTSQDDVDAFIAATPGLQGDALNEAIAAREVDFATQRWIWVIDTDGTSTDHQARTDYPLGVYAQDDGLALRLVFQHHDPGCPGTIATGDLSTFIYDAVVPLDGEVLDCRQQLTSCEE